MELETYLYRNRQSTESDRSGPARVVVFIPALNEEDKIAEVITTINERYRDSAPAGFTVQTIVVDDGSTDLTVEKARAAGVDGIVSHPQNLGLGAATRTGMQTALDMGADIAVKIDADFQHDPVDIERVLVPLLEDRADIVYGSRFAGKINYRMPLVRNVGNRFFTWLMRRMTGWAITDAQTGLMAYGSRYLDGFNIVGDYNAPQQIILDAHNRHLRYAEVPVVFNPRTTGDSFISFRYPFKVFPQILRIMMLGNPLRIFVNLGLCFLGVAFILAAYDLYMYLNDLDYKIHNTMIALITISGIQTIFFGLLADLIRNRK